MLEELQKVVGELYQLYGATTQVVKLSQILDELIVEAQNNNKKEVNTWKRTVVLTEIN